MSPTILLDVWDLLVAKKFKANNKGEKCPKMERRIITFENFCLIILQAIFNWSLNRLSLILMLIYNPYNQTRLSMRRLAISEV